MGFNVSHRRRKPSSILNYRVCWKIKVSFTSSVFPISACRRILLPQLPFHYPGLLFQVVLSRFTMYSVTPSLMVNSALSV